MRLCLIVPRVSSYRRVRFSRAVLFCEDKLSNAVLTSSFVLLLFVRFVLRVGGVDSDCVLDLLLSVLHAVVKHLEECVSALVRHQHGKYGLLHKVQSIYCVSFFQ